MRLEALAMLPEVQARRLVDQTMRYTLLRPPYAALGVGILRVLRVREGSTALDVVVGYESYERLS